MKLKLCGMRRPADIEYVNASPPDYVGFVFAKSPRQVTPAKAGALTRGLRPTIRSVGVFVNAGLSTLLETARTAGLQVLQLHGEEDVSLIAALRARWPGEIWKAVRVRTADDIRAADRLPVDALLLDAFSETAHGGTGKTLDLQLLAQNRPTHPFFLAGGLHPGNLREAIRAVRPYGVDLSSGIETKGVKDREKIQTICQIVRGDAYYV